MDAEQSLITFDLFLKHNLQSFDEEEDYQEPVSSGAANFESGNIPDTFLRSASLPQPYDYTLSDNVDHFDESEDIYEDVENTLQVQPHPSPNLSKIVLYF